MVSSETKVLSLTQTLLVQRNYILYNYLDCIIPTT